MSDQEKGRRALRFSHPAFLQVKGENGVRHILGKIEGTGESGMIFVGDADVPAGSDVELTIHLPHHIRVSSPAKVANVERRSRGNKVMLSIECLGPMLESSIMSASRRRSASRRHSA